jgi:hypothetical protein
MNLVNAQIICSKCQACNGLVTLRSAWLFFWPNKSVKGTRRPLAVLKFRFLSGFGGFA